MDRERRVHEQHFRLAQEMSVSVVDGLRVHLRVPSRLLATGGGIHPPETFSGGRWRPPFLKVNRKKGVFNLLECQRR